MPAESVLASAPLHAFTAVLKVFQAPSRSFFHCIPADFLEALNALHADFTVADRAFASVFDHAAASADARVEYAAETAELNVPKAAPRAPSRAATAAATQATSSCGTVCFIMAPDVPPFMANAGRLKAQETATAKASERDFLIEVEWEESKSGRESTWEKRTRLLFF